MTDVRTELRRASELVGAPNGSFERLRERRERAHRRGRITAVLVASVVAVASTGGLAALVALDTGPSDVSGWQPSRRLELLPGEYSYVRVTSDEGEDGWIRDVETWWGLDGSGEVRNRSTRQDKYPYPPSGSYGVGAFPVDIEDVASLPTDAVELATELRSVRWDWAGTGPGRLFEIAQLLLLDAPYVAPELRASLFEVTSEADGVRVLVDRPDPRGRPAIVLERSDASTGATWRLFFDRGTRQAIAWTYASPRGGSAWVLLESAIVDRAGVRPDPAEWLVPPLADTP
jgi:hypothetical protein